MIIVLYCGIAFFFITGIILLILGLDKQKQKKN